MFFVLIVCTIIHGFTITEGFYSKSLILEDENAQKKNSSVSNCHVMFNKSSFSTETNGILLQTIKIKITEGFLVIYYLETAETNLIKSLTQEECLYLRFMVEDKSGQITHYYDNFVGLRSNAVTTRYQYYLYLKHLIFVLLVSIHEYSLLDFFPREKIAAEVRKLQDEGRVQFYFFNKIDVSLSLGPALWVFLNIKKPDTMNLVEYEYKCDFIIQQLLILFDKILKISGDFFYDIRKYDKKKYENSMSDFRLYNVYLMAVDCTNLFNALINRSSPENRRKFIFKLNFEIKEIFSKCVIITLSKKQCQTIVFQSIRLKRQEKDTSGEEIIYFLDIHTYKIIIDIDNQNPPLKSVLLTFKTRNKKKMEHIITFDPLSIK